MQQLFRCQVLALLVIQLCHRLSWWYLVVKQRGTVSALGPLAPSPILDLLGAVSFFRAPRPSGLG